ncbi:hypothetical protein [Candidatus Nanohalococcus occultus]|uniref:hypothetical protein n=1 Tax=Candidatus Nanohalococcus occultus TaxID=2978047 RepID=UPI0039E14298
MSLEIDPDKAMAKIDEFLEQIDELLDKRYDEGKEQKRAMSTKLDNFTKVAFSEGDQKVKKLHRSVGVIGGKRTESEKQERYEDSLKRKKRNLEAWQEQIELEEDVESLYDADDTEEREEENQTSNDEAEQGYIGIKNEIVRIEDELPLYADELKKSLERLNDGHLLASVMITGRVIDYTLDQIKSSQQLGNPEEVLEHLDENNIADSEGIKITDTIKSYRDKYTHELGTIPPQTDAIIILAGCTKLLHNIIDEEKKGEYNLA